MKSICCEICGCATEKIKLSSKGVRHTQNRRLCYDCLITEYGVRPIRTKVDAIVESIKQWKWVVATGCHKKEYVPSYYWDGSCALCEWHVAQGLIKCSDCLNQKRKVLGCLSEDSPFYEWCHNHSQESAQKVVDLLESFIE